MKNTKRVGLVESSCPFLIVGFLILFSPFAGKAQNNSAVECGFVGKWIQVNRYNVLTGRTEPKLEYETVYECVPTTGKTNSAISRGGNSTNVLLIRNDSNKRITFWLKNGNSAWAKFHLDAGDQGTYKNIDQIQIEIPRKAPIQYKLEPKGKYKIIVNTKKRVQML